MIAKNKRYLPNKLVSGLRRITLFVVSALSLAALWTVPVYADTCGGAQDHVTTSINIGCKGKGNPIIDMMFAILRFLSIGVGIVLIGALIVAGIQYTTSAGDSQATQKAMKRIGQVVAALFLYVFAFALLNWLIPGAVLK